MLSAKSDQEGQGWGRRGVRGHKEAPLPCHPPGLTSLCCHPLRSSPPATPLITLPPRSPPRLSPRPTRIPCPSPVRHATPLSPPPATRPSLCHPPRTRSCVSPGKHASGWCMEARWASTDIIHARTHTIPLQWTERADKQHLDRERDREGERGEGEREWSPLIKWFFTILLCIFGLTWPHSGEIINKCMAYINIAFDSRQVAGWEQMLGAERETGLNRGDLKSFFKVLYYGNVHGITKVLRTYKTKGISTEKLFIYELFKGPIWQKCHLLMFSNSNVCL